MFSGASVSAPRWAEISGRAAPWSGVPAFSQRAGSGVWLQAGSAHQVVERVDVGPRLDHARVVGRGRLRLRRRRHQGERQRGEELRLHALHLSQGAAASA